METFAKVKEGVKGGWDNLDKKKRIMMISLIVGIILLAMVFTHFARKVNYVTLFTNLELEDAGRIAEDLKEKKIAYKLENGGRDISIDEKHINEYRIQLAMDGLMPENSSGFEIFDDMGLMVTDEDRKVMYQRALAGELQRSIMSLDAIDAAKVHLVMSEKSIFETKEKDASASVVVDINPNKKVTEEMVRGIVALVSGAVENLPEENVQVIDSKGNRLNNFTKEENGLNSTDIVNKYQVIKEEFEQKMESNLKDLLGSVFGRDNVRVKVYADLDFDAEENTTITYSDPVVRSQHISGTNGGIGQGITGGNINDNISNIIEGAEGEDGSYDITINNEVSEETKKIIKAPGKINKLTTSVVYDGNLSDEASERILNMVAAATGYDAIRGDFINIEGMTFDRTEEEQLQKELDAIKDAEKNKGIINMLKEYKNYIIIGIGVLLAIIILTVVLRKLFFKKDEEDDDDWTPDEYFAPGAIVEDTTEIEKPEEYILEVEEDSKKTQAQNYAKENPELAADLIKAWVKD